MLLFLSLNIFFLTVRASCFGEAATFYFAPYSEFTGTVYFVDADPTNPEPDAPLCFLRDDDGDNIWMYEGYPYDGTQPGECPNVLPVPADPTSPDTVLSRVSQTMYTQILHCMHYEKLCHE